MQLAVLFFFLSVAYAQTNTAFSVPIYYSEPSMNGGALSGVLYYDWTYGTTPSYFLDFSSQVYSVLYQYNFNRGYTLTKGQWRYRYGPGCPGGCETGIIADGMPQLFVNSNYTLTGTRSVNGQTCQAYRPVGTTAASPVSELLVRQSDNSVLCAVYFNNGNVWLMTGNSQPLTTATANTVFTPKLNCSCGKPIDISLVIDLSGSISVSAYKKMNTFMNSLINSFKIGTNQAQFAITWFNTQAYPILNLSASYQAVSGTINSLKCDTDNPAASCKPGWTSISSGLKQGAALIAKNSPATRSFATHVLVLLTDGVHNTLADGKNTLVYLQCDPAAAGSNIVPYAACGDKNGDTIPDDWQTVTCTSQTSTSCTWSALANSQRDLLNAREYALNIAGNDLIIFAVGVGAVSLNEMKLITNNMYVVPAGVVTACTGSSLLTTTCLTRNYVPCSGGRVTSACVTADYKNPDRVMFTDNFDTLATTLLEITSKVCDSNSEPCGQCCGHCKCGECTRPDICTTANYCDVPAYNGACCSSTPRVCNAPNLCFKSACDRAAKNGTGDCVNTPTTCSAENDCYRYECNPSTGACESILKAVPATDNCHISACINGVLYNNTPKVCTGNDQCVIYSCNAAGNCISTPKAFPAPVNCYQWLCNSSDTDGNPFYQVPILCPVASNACFPLFCNNDTGNCELKPVQCRDTNNLCDITPCDSVTGLCGAQTYVTCTDPNCKTNCTCQPTTGQCRCLDRICPYDCLKTYCDVADNVCKEFSGVCSEACINATCGSLNNQCFQYECDPNVTATADFNNCNIMTNLSGRCTAHLNDTCLINPRCDNTSGCLYDQVACDPPAPCFDLTRDSTFNGCCKYTPRVCPGDLCNTASCDNTTNICITTPVCNASDICTSRGCNISDGVCWEALKPCVSTDGCILPIGCSIEKGGCTFESKVCNDEDKCTIDSCNNGTCSFIPKVCNDQDACTRDSCSGVTGECVFTPIVCNDNNTCSDDVCDSNAAEGTDPCIYTFKNVTEYCNDNNLCTDDFCDPSNGCYQVPIIPEERCNVTDPCNRPVCIPTFGCQTVARVCVLTANGSAVEVLVENDKNTTNKTDCSYSVCEVLPYNDSNGNRFRCAVRHNECGFVTTTVLIASITAGAIAGIVIALVVFIGLCGGGVYAAVKNMGVDGLAQVQENPLYEARGKGGDNPLHTPR